MKRRKRSMDDEYGDAGYVDSNERTTNFTLSSSHAQDGDWMRGAARCSSSLSRTPSNKESSEKSYGRAGGNGSSESRKRVTFEGPVTQRKAIGHGSGIGGGKNDTESKHNERDNGEDGVQLTHTSSSFELAEKGASKVLIDSVQFQLDGLFTKNVSLRRRSAWKLFELSHSKDSLSLFRSTAIMKALMRVVGLLLTEEDEAVELTLIALAIVLIQRTNRKISFQLPSTSFQALILCSLDKKSGVKKSIRDSIFGQKPQPLSQLASQDSEHNRGVRCSSDGVMTLGSGGLAGKRRIKRKFSGSKGRGDAEGVNQEQASSVMIETAHKEELDFTYQPADVAKNLMVLWPKMSSALCLGDGAETSGAAGQALALSCVSSFLVSKAQACASIGSGYGRFSTSPSFRGNERDSTEETLKKCQQSLSERPRKGGGSEEKDKESPSYLQMYATQLIEAMNRSIPIEGSHAVQLWQLLGVVHASCYRHAANQKVLVEPVQCMKRAASLPAEVFSFLLRLAPSVISHVTSSMRTFELAKREKSSTSAAMASPDGSDDDELCDFLCHELCERGGCDQQDLFLASLKTLVNLTHGNEDAAIMLLEQEKEGSLLQMLSFFNSHLSTMRCSERLLFQASSEGEVERHGILGDRGSDEGHGILSPNEDPLENLVFSATLHLVSLLTNLSDSAPQKAQSVLSSRQNHPVPDLSSGNNPSDRSDLHSLAAGLLMSSSASFIEGISETDELVRASLSSRPLSISSPSAVSTVTPDQGMSDRSGDKDQVPVADLVLSAHVCMLLLVIGCPNRPKVSSTESVTKDDQSAVDFVTSPRALEESSAIRDLLPQKSWWLPLRTLKAFLALQNSTGIFLSDNLVQVLEAIRVMELQSTVTQPPEPGVSGEKNEEIEECGYGDATIVTPFPISTGILTWQASSRSNLNPQPGNVEAIMDEQRNPDWLSSFAIGISNDRGIGKQEELLSKWKWDGSDMVSREQSVTTFDEKTGEGFNTCTSTSASPTSEQQSASFKLGDVLSSEWLTETSSNKAERKFGRRLEIRE